MDKTCHQGDRIGGGDENLEGRGERSGMTYLFPPRKVIDAVAFHLLDEGIAARVCPKSVRRVVKRLCRAAMAVQISAALWQRMDNRQRLQWLLSSTCTDYRVGDGTAVLV
jgi:hypothetical protein